MDGEEARTAWGRRAKDFYGGSSSGESSDDEESLQLRVAEAVRVTEVEDVEGMNEEHFGADPRVLEGLRKLLDMQGKALPADTAAEKKGDGETDDQELLWQARLDAVRQANRIRLPIYLSRRGSRPDTNGLYRYPATHLYRCQYTVEQTCVHIIGNVPHEIDRLLLL